MKYTLNTIFLSMQTLKLQIVCLLIVFMVAAGNGVIFAADDMPLEMERDPVKGGLMHGYPLPDDKIVTLGNWVKFPQNRWAFRNIQALFPTSIVRRSVAPSPLIDGRRLAVEKLILTDASGKRLTGREYIERNYVDSLIVLHKGKVVYEGYFDSQKPFEQHLWMSASKSVTGLVALMLADQGVLDLEKTAGSYVKEIDDTPFGQAKLRDLLNMEVNIKLLFSTALPNLPAFFWSNMNFLSGLQAPIAWQAGTNGERFFYINNNPQTIGMVMTKVTGKSWAQLVHEMIWSKLGTEEDANIIVDTEGQAMSAGGFSTTARDAARFVDMIRNDGFYNGKQIVPKRVIAQMRQLYDNVDKFSKSNVKAARAGMSYKYYWYQVNDGNNSLECIGIYGQRYHLNPKDGITIVQQASFTQAQTDSEEFGNLVGVITHDLRSR